MSYAAHAAHAAFIAPAARFPAIWRLVLGLVTALVVYVGAIAGLAALAEVALGRTEAAKLIAQVQAGGTPLATLLMLTTFVGMALGAIFAAFWHWRGFLSLIGPVRRTARHFLAALAIAVLILAAASLAMLAQHDLTPNLALPIWLSFLPLALLAILVQTGAEELLFRGYLQQQLAARFSSPLIWMILPTLLFGALHFDPNNPGATGFLVIGAATIFGFCAADLTARTGSLGAAWGFHMANNIAAFLMVSLPDSRSGLSLYVTQFGFEDTQIVVPMILQDIATTLVIWIAIRAILRQKATIPE